MKNLFSESLNSRILKYSVAAGAVLLGTKEIKASVIHHSSLNLTNVSQFTIDFDGDGTIDLKVVADLGTKSDGVAASAVRATGKLMGHGAGTHYASALSSGVTIGPSGSFGNGYFGSEFLVYSSNPPWPGAVSKFLGVKFTGGDGQTHYGWVKLSCSAAPGPFKFDVYDYAYESTPNTAINGGTLPVVLTTFTANNLEDKIELKWNTSTEANNYGFDIERKLVSNKQYVVGNEIWEKIGFVAGHGNSNSPKNYSFVDKNPVSGDVEYRLKQIDNDGNFKYSHIVIINSLPTKFELWQNYPNPFNPTTTIQYAIPKAEHVTLKVYDELGNEVKTLVDGNKAAGQYIIQFNGSGLASGIYYYRISAGDFMKVKKLMMLK